jgi:hypothetical protein
MLLNNRRLNMRYEVKIYYLCNNDSRVSTNSSINTYTNHHNTKSSIFEINTLQVDTPKSILKLNRQLLKKGKYSIEIKPVFINGSKYCSKTDECPYFEDNQIYCETCSKLVYFIDFGTFKQTRTVAYKPTESDMMCLKNSKKYSKLSSFLSLTVLDSYEGSLISYQNGSIFNTDEAYLVNLTMPISVSLDLTSDSQCNTINMNQILEIEADTNDLFKNRSNILVFIGYIIACSVGIFALIFCVIQILNYNLESFCKYICLDIKQQLLIIFLKSFFSGSNRICKSDFLSFDRCQIRPTKINEKTC